jgi:hypothetical protein
MLTEFRLATFDGCLDTEFHIIENDVSVCVLKLTEILENTKTPQQEVFSLILHGPREPFVPQGMRHLKHDKLGELELFLVPIGKVEDGFEYQSVFNLLLQPRE